jgi:type II secretory pathway pseudopilin PulG
MSTPRGFTLLEALVFLVLTGLILAALGPALAQARGSAVTVAGARYLAITLTALRWKSVAEGRAHGLYFSEDERGWSWIEVRDSNGNGLRAAEIRGGIDERLGRSRRLEEVASGVFLGFPDGGPFPEIPPKRGWIDDLDDPIRIGNTQVLSFSPLGTSSSGTLYVTDRKTRLFAVVLYGRTAKLRVWRYAGPGRAWTS